jgi:hypothetical protein
MIDWKAIKDQTMGFRTAIVGLLSTESERADIRPPTWNNTLHWHAGHLVTTPRLLTLGLLQEPLDIPADYRRWFAKGTSPKDWTANDAIPSFESLLDVIIERTPVLFDALEDRAETPFTTPYQTSVGILLRNPMEALTFSLVHDGTHMGMIMALKRGLDGMRT